jgi:hypothetical protein
MIHSSVFGNFSFPKLFSPIYRFSSSRPYSHCFPSFSYQRPASTLHHSLCIYLYPTAAQSSDIPFCVHVFFYVFDPVLFRFIFIFIFIFSLPLLPLFSFACVFFSRFMGPSWHFWLVSGIYLYFIINFVVAFFSFFGGRSTAESKPWQSKQAKPIGDLFVDLCC